MKSFAVSVSFLLAAAAAVAAPLTDAQLDEIEHGILRLQHGYDRNDALAAFARQEGSTRDDMSAGLVAIIERRTPETNRVDAVREFAIVALGVFGGTNALPALRRIALDPDDPNGLHAIYAHGRLVGFSDETLSWVEPFLLDVRPERNKRRTEFLNVFRHSLGWDGLPAPERNALGRCLLRVTEASDDSPAWTDQVLCRAFPDYAGSAERRARLEAALARIPPSPAQRTDSAPDGPALLRASVSNALATAVATNTVPFTIPDARAAPPALRVLPDEFVLPEIPQEWRQ